MKCGIHKKDDTIKSEYLNKKLLFINNFYIFIIVKR